MDRTDNNPQMPVRYAVSTAGIFLVAFSISLLVRCNLGVNTLSGPAYVLSLSFPDTLTLGQYAVLVNCTFIFIQLALLRRRFKPMYLLQIAASFVLGCFIDMTGFMLSWLSPANLVERVVLLFLGCAISALGVSLEVVSDSWMLSAEMTAEAVSIVSGLKFRDVKVAMDCTILVITVGLCLVFFGNPLCAGEFTGVWDALTAKTPGAVVGIGTIAAAALIGYLMRFTDPIAERWLRRLLK